MSAKHTRKDRKELASEIAAMAKVSFGDARLTTLLKRGTRLTTTAVKNKFGDLGHQMGYQVAAAGYARADVGEWLYDMVWWLAEDDGLMVRQALVLECEWKYGIPVENNADIDVDFEKLIQARADVRVWISSSHNPELARKQIDNCMNQIARFSQSESGDTYIFVISEWQTPTTLIEVFEAP